VGEDGRTAELVRVFQGYRPTGDVCGCASGRAAEERRLLLGVGGCSAVGGRTDVRCVLGAVKT
jgi:hypothetical protein